MSTGICFEHGTREILIGWEDYCYLRIHNGIAIDVQAEKNGNADFLKDPILGLAMAMALQQRHNYVLHGSAVAIRDQAALFIGDRGQGKSTLAAGFRSHGYSIMADDVSAIDFSGGVPRVRPGFPKMKLWPDTLEQMGEDPSQYPAIIPGYDKKLCCLASCFHNHLVPLAAIFVLATGPQLSIAKIGFTESILALNSNRMGSGFTKDMPRQLFSRIFDQCAIIAKTVPVFQLTRPRDFTLLSETVKKIAAILT
ncbi:MAG: hypothetical protein Q7U88_08570 [Desulfocapsaceae bacterium]|nr:hypothetical protein [Desulfocapsaceae bacterium]